MDATRGEQRFAAVTYSKLVEWTGLKLNTVRHYATRGAFDRWNLESVLTWVNGRRAAAGLPLIGMPKDQSPEAIEERLNDAGVKMVRWIDPVRIPIPSTASGGYNPKTGEYDL